GEPEVRHPRSLEPQQQHEHAGHHENDRHHGDADRSAHLHPPWTAGAQRRLPPRSYRYSRYPMSPGERPASVRSVAASACCWAAWLTMCIRYCHSGRRSLVNAELARRPTSASDNDASHVRISSSSVVQRSRRLARSGKSSGFSSSSVPHSSSGLPRTFSRQLHSTSSSWTSVSRRLRVVTFEGARNFASLRPSAAASSRWLTQYIQSISDSTSALFIWSADRPVELGP